MKITNRPWICALNSWSFISYFQKKESEAVKHFSLNKLVKAVCSKPVICRHLAAQTWYNISMGAV